MLETESLEIGTAAAGSVSLDKAEEMSAFSDEENKQKICLVFFQSWN